MRVGIYGGSFNPVHYGHVNVARRAMDELSLDRLVVVPANVSPFKSETPTVFDRLARVKAAFAGMDKVVVDEQEIRRGGISYSIDTVRAIVAAVTAEHPGENRFFLVIGEDSVAGLPRWKDFDALAKLVTFASYPRTRESSTEIRRLFAENRVTTNPDARLAEAVEAGVVRKGGYCPCRLAKEPRYFCPCDEFKAQLADPAFHGFCHCRLYLKP